MCGRQRNCVYDAEIGSKKVRSSPFLRHSWALSRKWLLARKVELNVRIAKMFP
jgi:hypothetical protein